MKHFYKIPVLAVLFSGSLISCGDDLLSGNGIEKITELGQATKPSVVLTRDEEILLTELSNQTPKISMEQAVEIADNFFNRNTLSKRTMTMPQCEVLTRTKQKLSKSDDGSENIDTMLYILNYDDGFAVVSADVRVPEQILAYSDEGSIHLDSENPGINLFMDMAQDYIDLNILMADAVRDSLEKSLNEKLLTAVGIPLHTLSKYKRMTSKKLVYEYNKSTYISTDAIVGPYTKTYWHQRSPYNNSVPTKDGKDCPAGCVALAVSQLMAYWQWPMKDIYGVRLEWSTILDNNENNTYRNYHVSRFIYNTGRTINTIYDIDGSDAYTEDALKLLKKYGYTTGNIQNYSFSKVQVSLDNKYPVIIDGDSKTEVEGKTSGHCWLIDGYAKTTWNCDSKKSYVVMYIDDVTGEVSGELQENVSSTTDYYYYQHFNWGGGESNSSNGYYLSKVFDNNWEYKMYLDKQPELLPAQYVPSRDYKYNVRIITDIKH
ncbi:MAG: C10 family peptidase [Bacteroidales bacterium]|nr:C10 family peptidase [Bacteroidales bacterium]